MRSKKPVSAEAILLSLSNFLDCLFVAGEEANFTGGRETDVGTNCLVYSPD